MAHYSDTDRFNQLADTLPLTVIWRTALAQTWARIVGAPPRPAPAPPDGNLWKRLSELEERPATTPDGD